MRKALVLFEMDEQTSGKRAFFGYFLPLVAKSYSLQAKLDKSKK
jgi:hypothetical protein